MLFQMFSLVLDAVVSLLAGTCLLRLWMQRQRIGFNQPMGRFVFAMTDWLVMPLRRVLPGWSRWDLSSLLAAWLLKLGQYLVLWLVLGRLGGLGLLPLVSLVGLAQLAVSSISALVLAYALMSWVQPGSLTQAVVERLCEPWLRSVRRVLPLVGGIDLSPLAVLLLLQLLGMLLASLQGSWMA